MRDYTDLESAVRDEGSKWYLHEAVAALSSGANRAALVSLWTGVTLDLMHKVRRLADTSDKEAEVVAKEIDRAIQSANVRNMQRVEFALLANAEKLEIISARQREELERVRDDRNLCAHPAFVSKGEVFRPSIELVRSHIATAVDCCLSLPAITGKQVIQMFEDDLASDSWPDAADTTSFIRHRYLMNVRESTRRNITKLAIKYALAPGMAKPSAIVDSRVVAYRCRCFINALALIDRGLLQTCLVSVLGARRESMALTGDCLLRSFGAFSWLHEYWEFLQEDEVIALDRLLRCRDTDSLLDLDVFASGVPTNARIASSCSVAFNKIAACDPSGIDRLIANATSGRETLAPLVVSNLESAYSYRDAEQRLNRVVVLACYLKADDIRSIGRATRSNNQIYEASGTQALLMNIYQVSRSVVGAHQAWEELAAALNEDYLERHPENPDGYYSYSQLLALVRA